MVPQIMQEFHKTGLAQNGCAWAEKVSFPSRSRRLRVWLIDWTQNILHNTIGGKYNRGMTVPDTYRILKGVDELTQEEYNRSSILGWCTELVSSHASASVSTTMG